MWAAQIDPLANHRGTRTTINTIRGNSITFADALHGWQFDAKYRAFFNALLADAPYRAFRWETPPVTVATLTRPFEFVLLDAPNLERPPDSTPFAERFADAQTGAVTFPNLGGDAILAVPEPLAAPDAYGHLAAFVRSAPAAQRNTFWQTVGAAMARRLSNVPVWLSTAEAGVAWLHVRLDDRPKYYGYGPYRQANASE